MDALNAYTPGSEFPPLPVQCILRWHTFQAWRLRPLTAWLDHASEFANMPCELERLLASRVEQPHRRTLEAACPRLRELEVMNPLERCERTRPDEQMTCRPLP